MTFTAFVHSKVRAGTVPDTDQPRRCCLLRPDGRSLESGVDFSLVSYYAPLTSAHGRYSYVFSTAQKGRIHGLNISLFPAHNKGYAIFPGVQTDENVGCKSRRQNTLKQTCLNACPPMCDPARKRREISVFQVTNGGHCDESNKNPIAY